MANCFQAGLQQMQQLQMMTLQALQGDHANSQRMSMRQPQIEGGDSIKFGKSLIPRRAASQAVLVAGNKRNAEEAALPSAKEVEE